MTKKLYVGNLSYNTTDESLSKAFSEAGNVENVTIISDKVTGRSRGFGFVEMANEDEANRAIEMWDGKELDGRNLTVNIAREPKPRFNKGRKGSSFKDQR